MKYSPTFTLPFSSIVYKFSNFFVRNQFVLFIKLILPFFAQTLGLFLAFMHFFFDILPIVSIFTIDFHRPLFSTALSMPPSYISYCFPFFLYLLFTILSRIVLLISSQIPACYTLLHHLLFEILFSSPFTCYILLYYQFFFLKKRRVKHRSRNRTHHKDNCDSMTSSVTNYNELVLQSVANGSHMSQIIQDGIYIFSERITNGATCRS